MIENFFKTADWKNEKHVPAISCPDSVEADEMFEFEVSVGKEISHPNTTEHHIRWIQLMYVPEGSKTGFQVGSFEFTAHGESGEGADKGPVYTGHSVVAKMRIANPGLLIATSYCNIHGFWEGSKEVKIK